MNDNNKQKRPLMFYISMCIIVVLALFIVFWGVNNSAKGVEINYSEAVDLIEGNYSNADGDIEKATYLVLKDGTGYISIKEIKNGETPTSFQYHFTYSSVSDEQNLVELCRTYNIENEYQNASNFASYIPTIISILMAILVIWFLFRMMSASSKGAMAFGKTKTRTNIMSKVRFSDIAGMDEEKAELQEIVEFLKNPKKFTDLGARIPKGVLLVGQPGTGKTLLAKAVAGESGVPFISISGSDFVEMFVGVGASRVRDLFDQAKKYKSCIIFIDEIDAVGRQRGAGLGGGNDEREQTLNQLLVEMDGFESNTGIIVLAATNRSDVLDPALLRPGRFDRQIYVYTPDVKGREGILRIHARNKQIDENVDFNVLARITVGFTGADIENMLNEAAILAARAGRPKIIMEDITEGINKVSMGPQKKSRLLTKKERELTAYHESGHTIVAKSLQYCEDVQEVSIIPRGHAGGYTMSRPENDDMTMSINKANDIIAMSMGGRIAEELIFKDITSGASSDMQQATKIAHAMVYDWGMSDKIGFLSLGSQSQVFIGRDYQTKNDFSEKLASIADEEMMEILNKNYKRAKEVLSSKMDILHEMAKLLLARETIYKEEVDMIMSGKKCEEVVAYIEEKERLQREKEARTLEERENQKKLEEFQKKIASSETMFQAGAISESDLNDLKMRFEEFKASIEAKKAEQEGQNLTVEAEKQEEVEKQEDKAEKKENESKNDGEN